MSPHITPGCAVARLTKGVRLARSWQTDDCNGRNVWLARYVQTSSKFGSKGGFSLHKHSIRSALLAARAEYIFLPSFLRYTNSSSVRSTVVYSISAMKDSWTRWIHNVKPQGSHSSLRFRELGFAQRLTRSFGEMTHLASCLQISSCPPGSRVTEFAIPLWHLAGLWWQTLLYSIWPQLHSCAHCLIPVSLQENDVDVILSLGDLAQLLRM